MENKLRMELDVLPTPATSFEALSSMQYQPMKTSRKKKAMFILAAVLTMILGGCVWAKESLRYGLWYLYGSHGWSDVQHVTDKFGFTLPETLDGIPFDQYNTWALTPQGASHLEAYLHPAYRPHGVDYAIWETVPTTLPDGTPTTLTHTPEKLDLNFGTTENPLWRHYFQFNEEGIWTGCDIPERYETVQHQGITIQVGDTFYYDSGRQRDIYARWAHWLDEERQVVFSICEWDYTDPDRVVECAKLIIDLNAEQ